MNTGKIVYTGKKLLSCFLAIILIILSCGDTWADEPVALANGDEFTEGRLKYKVIDEENKCVEVAAQDNSILTTGWVLEIPDAVAYDGITYRVTRVSDNAFENNRALSEVKIPDTVDDIGDNAFWHCVNLNNVIFPQSIEKIGVSAFRGCMKFTDIEIPEGVKEINENAFSSCSNVKKISLPGSLEIIGDRAFSVSGNLTDELTVNMKEGVKKIGEFAFASCAQIKEITIPSSVEIVGNNAFDGCSNLEKVILEGRIVKIPSGLFRECRSLKYINISDSVKGIGMRAFSECTGLETITIPASVMSFDESFIFENCTSLKEMKIAVDVDKEDTKSVTPISIDELTVCFQGIPTDRKLVFLNSDGTKELAGTSLAAAQKAYMDADDGDTTDNLWYGWKIGDLSDLYTVTIEVEKDGEKWEDHGKTFLLKNKNGYLIDDFQVESGTYTVCVKIGENVVDTGVTVEVKDSDTSVTLEYFTVTFYDDDTAYGNDTVWGQQIVRKGDYAVKPNSDPEKANFKFAGWKTDKEGSRTFDFGAEINDTTNIYASWSKASEEPSKPAETEKPTEPDKPTDTEKPSDTNKPTDTEKPSDTNKPTDTENPSDINKPTDTEKPSDTSKPTGTENPSDTNKPTNTEKPTAPNNPTDTETTTASGNTAGSGTPSTPSPSLKPNDSPEIEEPEASVSNGGDEKGEKPKTGDTNCVEIYATAAMIAGLSYVMLIFARGREGMTEEEKNIHVSALIEWSRKGSKLRKYAAFTAIFFLLLYYHSIGKWVDLDWKEICGNEKSV